MTFVIPFPVIDPIIFQVGPLAIRWYSLAYIAGLMIGWRYMLALARRTPQVVADRDVDDFLVWATLGVILGGRLGYVFFYQPAFFLENPLAILRVWQGGMSFHGGLLGVVIAGLIYVRVRLIPLLPFADLVVTAAPIGLFLGRIANFINGELWGRAADVPWAMVFPNGGPHPRHPSQLYEALLEGLVLMIVLGLLHPNEEVRRRHGMLSGIFLLGYALARSAVELFRQPDVQIGLLAGGTTMGQWLSAPMAALGVILIVRARVRG
jgi:phosphatidylglycerol---prolipoprotein diacylglyceryl transferase